MNGRTKKMNEEGEYMKKENINEERKLDTEK